MAVEREFNYTDAGQRRWVLWSTFVTTLILSFIASDMSLALGHFFLYAPVVRISAGCLLAGFFLGNLSGRVLFPRFSSSRIPYIVTMFLFITVASLFVARHMILPGKGEPVITVLTHVLYAVPLYLFIAGMLGGQVLVYFLKVSCGDYLDERHGVLSFTFMLCLGVLLGLLLPGFHLVTGIGVPWRLYMLYGIMPLSLIPGLFTIKLGYNPPSFIAKKFVEETETGEEWEAHREELFFTYLNIAYIVIYIFLASQMHMKYFSGNVPLNILFMAVAFCGLIPGMAAGRMFRNRLWPVYTQMLFPLSFFIYVFLLLGSRSQNMHLSVLLLPLIPLMVFGFALYRTVSMIAAGFSQDRRFRILDFSFFILPVPLIAALGLIPFTNMLYFVFLYFIAAMNILVPVVFLYNKKINPVKKFLFFILSMLFIPAIFILHFSMNIPMDGEYFIQRTRGYDVIQKTNYSLPYVGNRVVVTMDGTPVFRLNDSRVRNLKRAVLPVVMYHEGQSRILVIDGNQRFFRNPMYNLFYSADVIDPLTARDVDGRVLPISGNRDYIVRETDPLLYLRTSSVSYNTVMDVPNIRDQVCHAYRFSGDYYRTIKTHITPGGVFAQTICLRDIRPEFLYSAAQGLKENFRHSITFMFYDVMIILSSDSDDAFTLSQARYNYMADVLSKNQLTAGLFYSDLHFLSHFQFMEIDDLLSFLEKDYPSPLLCLHGRKYFRGDGEFFDNFTGGNDRILAFIPRSGQEIYLRMNLQNRLAYEQQILTVLKKTEIAEAEERYEDETSLLFSIRTQGDYKPDLGTYLRTVLGWKEEYYGAAAHEFEKQKRWEDAGKLYRAILTINVNNFEANYRMGFLSIVLQDPDNAFKYLSNAMRLKPGDPKVLYQMGVLLFSKGDFQGSINYLNQAIANREDSAAVYLYLGLANEELGRLPEAESFYNTAHLKDPNDPTIKSRIEGLQRKKAGVESRGDMTPMKNQMEDEQGEALPLPVNKSAYDVRLGDRQAEQEGGPLYIPVPLPETTGDGQQNPPVNQ